MKVFLSLFGAIALYLISHPAVAQQSSLTATDSLALQIQKIQKDLDALKKLKITGYIQTQYQHIQTPGAESMAGGNFTNESDSRFSVRRARLKTEYKSGSGEYVLQIDATERGVALRDAYAAFKSPWTNNLTLTTGIFKRPFSYEILESSSRRESPERARVAQMLFPAERDLGVKLTWQPSKASSWNFLKAEAGLFNATGGNASEFDGFKDFIGNIGINRTTNNGMVSYAARVSGHIGGFRQPNKYVWEMGTLDNGSKGFVVDSTETNTGKRAAQNLISIDTQISVKNSLGTTTFKGEYIAGRQPGAFGSTRTPAAAPISDTYIRQLEGGYAMLLHKISGTKHTLMVKYDWFDPNTKVSSDDLGRSNSRLSKTEVAYTNMALGWIYDVDSNIRITAYYDMPKNETSQNLAGYNKDLKDNTFTLRMQYKF
ncbi:porin [Alkaliflexus imshenetskii]|uniref:porin n=1 Tax=Alkaliflexus imshenetskii TaxID=286730 RepID=UPI00047A61DC|nr:porin [Alkaliflexus imshenetskii]